MNAAYLDRSAKVSEIQPKQKKSSKDLRNGITSPKYGPAA